MRVLVTGGSRGIGAATARLFAARGATQVALLGRSFSEPAHAALDGTLLQTARDVEACGAAALPFEVDFRDAKALQRVLGNALRSMGGLDVLVNNASALTLDAAPSPKQMDLLHQVNVRGTTLCLQTCREALAESAVGAAVTLSPPIRLGRLDWLRRHAPYTISKYGMTLATLAAAGGGVRANALWPRHTVATAATRALEAAGHPDVWSRGRDPGDVALAIHTLAVERTEWNARTLLDDEVCELPPPRGAPLDVFVDEAAPGLPLAP
jgi:citronellol/citronellal dehydrogenase